MDTITELTQIKYDVAALLKAKAKSPAKADVQNYVNFIFKNLNDMYFDVLEAEKVDHSTEDWEAFVTLFEAKMQDVCIPVDPNKGIERAAFRDRQRAIESSPNVMSFSGSIV